MLVDDVRRASEHRQVMMESTNHKAAGYLKLDVERDLFAKQMPSGIRQSVGVL